MLLKVKRAFKYFTFGIFVVYILLEAFARIFKGENMALANFPKIYTPDTVVGYRGIPYAKGYIRRPSIKKEFVLNNQGFFGPDFYPEHPDSIYRIMVFGTSSVEGIWGDNTESFPATMNRLFKAAGYKVEVINCGLSGGFRSLFNVALIRQMASVYKPDLVLFESPIPISNATCYRDIYRGYSITFTGENRAEREHSRGLTRKKVDLVQEHGLITDLYDMSYLVRFWARQQEDELGTASHTCRIYAKNCCDNWQYFSSLTTKSFEESIRMINGLQEELGQMHTTLALFEYGNSELGNKIRKSPAKFSFISLDLPLGDEKYRLPHDGHTNAQGYAIMAEGLCKTVKQQYLPARFFPQRNLSMK